MFEVQRIKTKSCIFLNKCLKSRKITKININNPSEAGLLNNPPTNPISS